MITLYDYYRSSAAFRVRIALNLKGIDYKTIPISLIENEQSHSDYKAINPQQLVPAIETEDHHIITQSLAIIGYLEEMYPLPSLLPESPLLRAQSRSLALIVACDIHPVNNLRVLKYITNTLHHTEEEKMDWYFHWLKEGFTAFEALLNKNGTAGQCCIHDNPSIADICLIPQVYNAKRFNFSLANYPEIRRIAEYCLTLPAFEKALPEKVHTNPD